MPELVCVRIKGTVATSRYGTLQSGDILRTDTAFARHLVKDCQSAEYVAAVEKPSTRLRARKERKKS